MRMLDNSYRKNSQKARTSYKFSKSSTMYHRLKIEIVPEMGQVSLIHDTISRD